MSLETTLTEEPLPNGVDAAQHAVSKPQLNSQPITLMPPAGADYCETPLSPSHEEVGVNAQDHDTLVPPESQPESEQEPEPDADAQILEALRSAKDRLFVLKLGESMESLIQDRHMRNRVELTPASTYHKLLVHRCAAYYKLTPETEAGSKTIALLIAAESRIPVRRVADLVPPDDSPLPAFKIMRRTPLERTRHKASSQGGSGNDDNAPGDISDGDPSENGSSRGSRRKPLTMSERQAQYEEARSRIFKDLEENETKGQDMSASSSTLSLLSVGSSSCGGGGGGASSAGESLDDAGSIDRDWVHGKDKTDSGRRTGNVASGNRRSTATPFNGPGHSPGFNYPTLYEPAPTPSASSSSSYESSPSSGSSGVAPYQPTLYPVYQFGAPAYLAPFPYPYYQYGPPPPHAPPPPHPHPLQHPTESSAASANGSPGSSPADTYPPPMTFVNPYAWGPPPPPPPLPHLHQPPQQQTHPQQSHPQQSEPQQTHPQQGQGGAHHGSEYPPSHPHPHPHYPHIPLHAYTYPPPGPGYLHPLPPHVPYPHGGPPQTHVPVQDAHRPSNPQVHHVNGTTSQPQLFQAGAYGAGQASAAGGGSTARSGSGGAQSKRMQPRSGWSYGPGVGGPSAGMTGETVGPRMSVARRTSGGNNVMSGYTGHNRTPGDETASTASSSTSSSSSRQTFPSNSSKHPLPARPDWAVGLKPQPTLHHSTSHHSSPRSHHGHLPSQSHHHSQQRPPMPTSLQSNDFPPLPVSPPNADKRPVLGGVWAGPTTTRSILGPSLSRLNNGTSLNGSGPENVNGVVLGDGLTQPNTRLDEHDHEFERPGPKVGGELFNPNGTVSGAVTGAGRLGSKSPPNGAARKVAEKEKVDRDKANSRGEKIANAILVDRVATMRIGPEGGEEQCASKEVTGVVDGGTAV